MFPEYKEIVSRLKTEDKHFHSLFQKHNELHHEVERAEKGDIEHCDHFSIEKMKKEKLKLKDEIYSMIVKFKNENNQ